jgi:hypothetical protein
MCKSRFFLTLTPDGKGLASDSVSNILRTTPTCVTDVEKIITCMGASQGRYSLGTLLYFDPSVMKGGVSKLLGAISKKSTGKDSLFVMPFVCQKVY